MTARFSSDEVRPLWNLRAWKRGWAARKDNIPINQCPYDATKPRLQKSWRAGWADADMSILLESAES